MHSLTRRIRHTSEDDRDVVIHPRFSHATWVAVAIGGAGLVTNLVGANQQRKAQAGTDASNRAAIQQSDLDQWKAYLIQRGLNPTGVTTFGDIPANAPAVNQKLPLWANLSFAPSGTAQGSVVRRRKPGVM